MVEHVGGLDQAQQRFACQLLLQVDRQAALVAVEVGEIAAHAGRAAGTDPARGVTFGGFDLDDVGAHVAEGL